MLKTVRCFFSVSVAIAAVALLGLASGCSAVGQAQDYLGQAVTLYCAQPADQRAGIRDAVNARTAPHVVLIRCASDHEAPGREAPSLPPGQPAARLDRPAPLMPAGTRVSDGGPPGSACTVCHRPDPGDDPEPLPA